jgi:hypothetical protein
MTLYQARKVSVYVHVCLCFIEEHIPLPSRYMYFYETKTNIYIHAHFPGLVEVYVLLWNKDQHLHTRALSWLGRDICTSMKQRETFTYTYIYLYQVMKVSVYVNVGLCFIEVHDPLPSQESERVCKCLSLFHRSTYTSTKPGKSRSLSWLGRGICTSMKQRQTFTYTLTFLAW